MPKATAQQPDVLVLGQHPCAYLAADLLIHKHARRAAHATIPGERYPERLLLLNPQFFQLHKPLEKLKKQLKLTAVYGITFLAADDGQTRGEWRAKNPVAYVACYNDVRRQLAAQAKESGVKLMAPKTLAISRIDEHGFEFVADQHTLRAKAVLLAGHVAPELAKAIGLTEGFADDVMRRYSFVRLKGTKIADPGPKPVIPMSLDLDGKLSWAWMLPGEDEVQLAVEQAQDAARRTPPVQLLNKWAQVLKKHGLLKADDVIDPGAIESIDLPAAGALSREIVANRTLLFGPAGGFYSACLEDLFPNCWSAVFATEAVCSALKEPHLQDSLQPYRQMWGATLGEYLRGPQQNLRFLLPLVYRNPVMTSRLAESILQGKSVVR